MAIYTVKKQDDQQNQPQGTSQMYVRTVESGGGTTGQQDGGKYLQYQQGNAAQQANQRLQQVMNNRPQGYNSKYSAQLDSIMQQIQNPEGFKYDFNGDELFKQYADLYTQKGKQASMDVMGQAAALTGGYGNSYAQQVADQAYQQKLLDLYSMAPEFYDRAWQRYQGEQSGLKDTYSMLADRDSVDYDRYRDTVADWEKDRDVAVQDYNMERGYEWQSGENALDRQAELDRLLQQQTWQSGENALQREEDARQFDTNLAWLKEQWAGDDSYRRDALAQEKDLTLSGRDWQSAESAAQRGWQTQENRDQRDWESAESAKQRGWQTAENKAQRGWQTQENRDQRDWESAESAKQRGWQTAENKAQRGWQTQENRDQRDWESAESAKQRGWQTAENKAQRGWQTQENRDQRDWESAESAKQRGWQTAENKAQRGWQTQENRDQRDWESAESAKQRGWQTAENKAQRGWQTQENRDQRDWESAESAAQRDWQAEQNDNELGYKYEALAQDTLNRDADRAQSAEQFDRTTEIEWAKLEEQQRQADANLSFDERKLKMQYAHDDVLAILANGQIPSNELLVAAGLSKEDAKKLIAQAQTGGTPTTKAETEGNSNVVYTDNSGNYYTYGTDKNGKTTKQTVEASTVGNNDLVHNIYTEGASRRTSNQNGSRGSEVTDETKKKRDARK